MLIYLFNKTICIIYVTEYNVFFTLFVHSRICHNEQDTKMVRNCLNWKQPFFVNISHKIVIHNSVKTYDTLMKQNVIENFYNLYKIILNLILGVAQVSNFIQSNRVFFGHKYSIFKSISKFFFSEIQHFNIHYYNYIP